jgi:hypothetical protein
MAQSSQRLTKKHEIAILHQSIGWTEGLIDSYGNMAKPLHPFHRREVMKLRFDLKRMRNTLEQLTGSRVTPIEALFSNEERPNAWKEAVEYMFHGKHQDEAPESPVVTEKPEIDPLLTNPFIKMFEKYN